MKNELGIVVPVYNVENYLESCVKSIIQQTYTNWKLILVNDASTDRSGAICDKYAAQDNRIEVIHLKENKGPINARYQGIKYLNTKYITFVDSDDWLDRFIYKKMMDAMLNNDVDMISARGIIRFRTENDYTKSYDLLREGLYVKDEIRSEIVPIMLWDERNERWGMDPSLCIKIFKRELLLDKYEEVFKYQFHYAEDTAIICPYVLECEKIYVIDACGYYHRRKKRNEIASYIQAENFYSGLLDLYMYLNSCFKKYEKSEILIKQLNLFYIHSVKLRKPLFTEIEEKIKYLFPFHLVEKNSSIVLYGAGKVGRSYYNQLTQLDYCKNILWVDKNYETNKNNSVKCVEEIFAHEYDYIVIAIVSEAINKLTKEWLMECGISEEKIVTYFEK